MRKRFDRYQKFAEVTFEETFTREELSGSFIVTSECFESSYLENKGNGTFERKALPSRCQFAPIFGMVTGDYNSDGHLDILITGNSYSTEVSTGNYDAMTGLLLLGNGHGNFQPVISAATGFWADRDSKGIAQINLADNSSVTLVANNNDKLQAYRFLKSKSIPISVNHDDAYALVHKKDGSSFRHELYFGDGYLSSSSRTLSYSDPVVRVTIYNNKGMKREIPLTPSAIKPKP